METKDKNKREEVKRILSEYLSLHGHRETSERFEILSTIYSINGHFTNEKLQMMLNEERKFRVSRATVYNTLDLFEKAGLVVCHRCTVPPEYERAYFIEPHIHLICSECGKMTEVRDTYIAESLKLLEPKHFKPLYHTLHLYGICSKCEAKLKREKNLLGRKQDRKINKKQL
ncbi:MAG: transcriptional repressor [Bacteroidaceae bacterium]|nr:transcriptional repressor [Bacteroidaceae bacterium]